MKQSATTHHFSAISEDFPLKKKLKPFFQPQIPVIISCTLQLQLCPRSCCLSA